MGVRFEDAKRQTLRKDCRPHLVSRAAQLHKSICRMVGPPSSFPSGFLCANGQSPEAGIARLCMPPVLAASLLSAGFLGARTKPAEAGLPAGLPAVPSARDAAEYRRRWASSGITHLPLRRAREAARRGRFHIDTTRRS